jgi:hypothetical protein
VLSRALVDEHLVGEEDVTICYFFFKDNEEQDSLVTALCALLHQLFCKHKSLLKKHGAKVFKKCGEALKQDTDELWKLFISAATDHSAGNIVCVLDALDECRMRDRKKLITRLERFYRSSLGRPRHGFHLKFLVTSRPYTEIELDFSSLMRSLPSIRLAGEDESEMISREIGIVAKSTLETIAEDLGLDEETHLFLHSQLEKIPNRTYLWLHLVLNEVRDSYAQTGAKLQKVLDTIPQNLEEAYERILGRCKGGTAKRILNIVVASQRPLTLGEIDVALEVNEALERSSDPAPSSLSFKDLDCEGLRRKKTIRNACGLFVSIVDSQVFLIHQTAKEFLLRKGGKLSEEGRWKSSIDIRDAHRILSMICVKYLLLPEIQDYSGPLYEKPGEYALLVYAASHWEHHVQEARDDDMSWIRQILKLCDLGDGSSCYWYRWRDLRNPGHVRISLDRFDGALYWPSAPQPKQIWAVVFGLSNLLQYLQGSNLDYRSLASSTKNLLDGAAEHGGHEDHPNSEKQEFTTPNFRLLAARPLHWHPLDIPIEFQALEALSKQPTAQEVMQVVFESQRPEFLINSMKVAAGKGTLGIAVMQLLLQQQGANNLITENIMKAAAESRSVELMQLLLQQQGVNSLITEEVMKVAAESMDLELMGLLLQQQGAKSLITEEVMKAAVESRNLDLIQLLLEHQGAEVLVTEEVIKAAATDLADSDCRDVMLLLLYQPEASTLITEEVWETISGLHYLDRVPLLTSLLGKITTTEEMIATFVRIFSPDSVRLLLDQRVTDILITSTVMQAALKNAKWSEELTLLLFSRYEVEAYEALMLLIEEGRVPFKREGRSFCVESSAGWLSFPLKGAASGQLQGASVAEDVNGEVDEVHKREGVASTPSLPRSQIEVLTTPDSSQDLHASNPNHTDVPSQFTSRVSVPSMQRIYDSIRGGLSILPWIETPIKPGHQRIYWRNVSACLVLSFMSSWMQDDD